MRRRTDAIGSLRAGRRRSAGAGSCDAVLLSPLRDVGPLGEQLLVGDGWEHLAAAVPAPMVVDVDEPGDLAAGLVLGGETPAGQQFVLEGRVEALGRGVVQR